MILRTLAALYRHVGKVCLAATFALLLCGWEALHLPVFANVSYLLPETSRSVQDLRSLEKRAQVLGTLMVAISSADASARLQVADAVAKDIAALGPSKVAFLTRDKKLAKRFAWDHRFLLASVSDLEQAKGALGPWLRSLSRRKNALALDLEAEGDSEAQPTSNAAEPAGPALAKRLLQLEREAHEPGDFVSADGRLQLLVVQTPFAAGSTKQSAALLADVGQIVARATLAAPAVEVGLAGDVVSSVEEERAILAGLFASTALTLTLVSAGLWLYYRSLFATAILCFSLLVGTLATFAITRHTVGHLNIATAFLTSIVLGNGINFGIMLLARFVETVREHSDPRAACDAAVASSWRGTLAAAVAASAAYVSLTVTDFRGFRDFGLIASGGMLLCWLSAYVLLPPLLVWGHEHGWLKPRPPPPIGRMLLRFVPKQRRRARLLAVLAMSLGFVFGAAYLAKRPFEQDFRNIRSDSPTLRTEQAWMGRIDRAFGSGISGGFVLAVDDRADAPALLARLRAANAPGGNRPALFGRLSGLDDYLPQDLARKRELLADIRSTLAACDLQAMPARARRLIERLMPPNEVPTWGDMDVPAALAWPFTELDGSRGKLILASSGPSYPTHSAPDLIAFTDRVANMHLGPNVRIGGSAFVFADMVKMVAKDGPRATLAAGLSACATILLLLGVTRYAACTLLASAVGVFAMLAGCDALGLKINFLDFVALPITIGIGIDYAVNLAARARVEGRGGVLRALEGAGGAICLASYTTIVGYGSMLLSSNRGIRSFGHAAILGEATCLFAGLWLTPILLRWGATEATDARRP